MNMKVVAAASLSLLVGLAISPLERKTVAAVSSPDSARFQLHSATVKESNGEGREMATEEVFLLDTQRGKVWKYQGLVWAQEKGGEAKVFSEPNFFAVSVSPAK